MRFILLLLTGLSLLAGSCNDLKDYSADINIPPSLRIKKVGDQAYSSMIQDSVKIIQGLSYNFKYRISYNSPLPLHYEFTKGHGNILVNSLDSMVSFSPETNENVSLKVYVTDIYSNKASALVNLELFYNLPPHAVFSYTVNDNILTINATGSYDEDKKWGGHVTEYEYSLNGIKTYSDNGLFIQEVEPGKSYQFTLRVKDNENVWSELSEQTINNF